MPAVRIRNTLINAIPLLLAGNKHGATNPSKIQLKPAQTHLHRHTYKHGESKSKWVQDHTLTYQWLIERTWNSNISPYK